MKTFIRGEIGVFLDLILDLILHLIGEFLNLILHLIGEFLDLMNVLDVQLELLAATEGVVAHFALVIADVEVDEFDVGVEVSVRHEPIPANLARILFQLQMNAVDVFLSRTLLRKLL